MLLLGLSSDSFSGDEQQYPGRRTTSGPAKNLDIVLGRSLETRVNPISSSSLSVSNFRRCSSYVLQTSYKSFSTRIINKRIQLLIPVYFCPYFSTYLKSVSGQDKISVIDRGPVLISHLLSIFKPNLCSSINPKGLRKPDRVQDLLCSQYRYSNIYRSRFFTEFHRI